MRDMLERGFWSQYKVPNLWRKEVCY